MHFCGSVITHYDTFSRRLQSAVGSPRGIAAPAGAALVCGQIRNPADQSEPSALRRLASPRCAHFAICDGCDDGDGTLYTPFRHRHNRHHRHVWAAASAKLIRLPFRPWVFSYRILKSLNSLDARTFSRLVRALAWSSSPQGRNQFSGTSLPGGSLCREQSRHLFQKRVRRLLPEFFLCVVNSQSSRSSSRTRYTRWSG